MVVDGPAESARLDTTRRYGIVYEPHRSLLVCADAER